MAPILETLNDIDTEMLVAINGAHNAFLDQFMWFVSQKYAWPIMILALLYVSFRRGWQRGLLIVLGLALTITLCDQVSSGLIKPLVQRLRPSHTPALEGVLHILNGYRSGQYGFVSSHAANSFGAAVFVSLVMRSRGVNVALIGWACLVSYCRMYLGVHYPGDILCGGLIGAMLAWVVWKGYQFFDQRLLVMRQHQLQMQDKRIFINSIVLNLLIIICLSVFMLFSIKNNL